MRYRSWNEQYYRTKNSSFDTREEILQKQISKTKTKKEKEENSQSGAILQSSLNANQGNYHLHQEASASKHLTKDFFDKVAFTLCPLHITGPVQKKYIRNTQHVKSRNIDSLPHPTP